MPTSPQHYFSNDTRLEMLIFFFMYAQSFSKVYAEDNAKRFSHCFVNVINLSCNMLIASHISSATFSTLILYAECFPHAMQPLMGSVQVKQKSWSCSRCTVIKQRPEKTLLRWVRGEVGLSAKRGFEWSSIERNKDMALLYYSSPSICGAAFP